MSIYSLELCNTKWLWHRNRCTIYTIRFHVQIGHMWQPALCGYTALVRRCETVSKIGLPVACHADVALKYAKTGSSVNSPNGPWAQRELLYLTPHRRQETRCDADGYLYRRDDVSSNIAIMPRWEGNRKSPRRYVDYVLSSPQLLPISYRLTNDDYIFGNFDLIWCTVQRWRPIVLWP